MFSHFLLFIEATASILFNRDTFLDEGIVLATAANNLAFSLYGVINDDLTCLSVLNAVSLPD